jgi:flagellin FlaB
VAIAAGVLINIAGFLQTQAQTTGEESTEQVSTNLVFLSTTGAVTEDSNDPVGVSNLSTTVQLGPGSSAIDLNTSTISLFTDSGFSAELDGVDESGITLESRDVSNGNTVLSTDSGDSDATATLVFDAANLSASNDRFDAGTTVDIVITTADGTQAETSFIIEDPLDPQLESGDEIRLA